MNTNKILKHSIIFSSSVAIYFPSKQQTGELIEKREQLLVECCNKLCDLFGGVTQSKAIGFYKLVDNSNQYEDVTICKSYTDKLTSDTIEIILKQCEQLKADCNQESIACEINNKLYLI